MSNPWKACDLRGVHPVDVSADLFRRLGTSFASSLPVGARVLIAGDFRASTPSLKAALAEGLLESGAHVLDSGQIPTPIAYFAHQRWKTDAIMIVTASHNPPEYNGLKLMMGSLPPTPGISASFAGKLKREFAASKRGNWRGSIPFRSTRPGCWNAGVASGHPAAKRWCWTRGTAPCGAGPQSSRLWGARRRRPRASKLRRSRVRRGRFAAG